MPAGPLEVKVYLMDSKPMLEIIELLGDAREAICQAMSEGWDMFSEETRGELGRVMGRIDALGAE